MEQIDHGAWHIFKINSISDFKRGEGVWRTAWLKEPGETWKLNTNGLTLVWMLDSSSPKTNQPKGQIERTLLRQPGKFADGLVILILWCQCPCSSERSAHISKSKAL